jgi:hypothetical protein
LIEIYYYYSSKRSIFFIFIAAMEVFLILSSNINDSWDVFFGRQVLEKRAKKKKEEEQKDKVDEPRKARVPPKLGRPKTSLSDRQVVSAHTPRPL